MNPIQQFKKEQLNQCAEKAAQSEKQRRNFVEDYPIENIQGLTIREYMTAKQGYGNPGSFCRRIQYDLGDYASMGNVPPDIFGIYLRNGKEITLSKTFQKLYDTDYEMAFCKVKEEIVRLLNNVQQGKYDEIKKCTLNSAFKYRLLIVYFPGKFVPVSTKSTLNEYCDRVGITYDPKDEMVYRNLALLEWRDSIPEIAEWDNAILMHFCDWLWREDKTIDGNALKKGFYTSKAKEIDEEIQRLGVKGESRDAIVKVRVNQGVFRDGLLQRYSRCCLCGVTDANLLIASHIKPWSVCSPEEKLDTDNGFLMCPNHDKLFDQGRITFDDNGKILISERLQSVERVFMNVKDEMKIELTEKNKEYLEYHRNHIFV